LRKNKIFQALIFIISAFFISACSFQTNVQHQSSQKKNENLNTKKDGNPIKWKLPITLPKGKFYRVCGWLTDDELIYLMNNGKSSTLYSYHLSSGKNLPLYKSDDSVEEVKISPSKKYILIQAAPSAYEGQITIIDSQGNEKYSHVIPSYELAYEWNPYQESQVLISVFQEDWSFRVLLVDFEQKMAKELSLPQPFLKWIGKDQLIYLNWNHNSTQQLLAPLMTISLANTTKTTLFPNVYQFSAFHHVIMTITVTDNAGAKGRYAFYDQKMHQVYSFTMPQLKNYSDWLVPFYDFNEKQQKFITFRPARSTNIDTYKGGFQLVSHDLLKGKSTVLFKGLANKPIALSPSGDACLYGNSFEKIIDLRTKKMIDVVKE
jgi:hypothetical protein